MSTRQRGVAIVLALSVVALAALAATAMLVSQNTWSRQVELTAGHAQAQHLLQAGLDWSRAVLSDDRHASDVDHLGEPWALRLPSMPVENGSLTGHVEDQQARFNLNNLLKDGKVNLAQLERFRRLLTILALPPALADSLADWVDADGEPQPRGGAEDAHYLALQPPHLAANRPLTDLGELALVAGFDDAVRARLRPFVTALPRFAAVNVNTASPEVIAATVDGLDLDDARGIVARRERTWFRDISEFTSQLPTGLSVPSETIAVSSDYFVATMSITIGGAQARGSALLAREHAGWPAIVWRKFP
ncbi:MAG: type II secretion system minor pseudopilin GspK [Lysobacter sp.]